MNKEGTFELVELTMNRKCCNLVFAIAVATLVGGVMVQSASALSGAIFTTDKNGHLVNGNIYRDKCDVYLDGGPGPHAPASSAALPEGLYFFQVTDPSGKVLLSTDDILDRQFSVNEYGVIEWASTHPTNEDKDGREYDAVVVQLCPFADTPNNGGVYKVWVTRQEDYDWGGSGRHGFIPAFCKTDNFKVGKRPPEQYICVRKFKDCNANGLWDEGEVPLGGWYLWITPPDGPDWVGEEFQTPYTIVAWPGSWTIREMVKDGWMPTGVLVDDIPQDLQDPPTAVVTLGTKDEDHTVAFGNIPAGCVTACKFYDRNFNGQWDDTGPDPEPGIQGVKVILTGSDVLGPIMERTGYTGPGGCVAFCDLLPGTYTVTEIVPTNCNWVPTTDTCATVELACEENAEAAAGFGNIITGCADFDTKGYWHNKNGLAEITESDIAYVNGLAPYSSPSDYFGAGDEPFDGFFTGGSPVAAAYENDKITGGISAGEGTPKAEISHFLVDSNADAELHGHREQLAQQLLAFIFNVRHRVGGGATIYVPGEGWVTTSGIIADAIAAWQSGSPAERVAMAALLDALNNNDAVEYVLDNPPTTCVPVPVY